VNVNTGASQWSTNLIGYDALSSFGSPSYYVQKMFSGSRGQKVLPIRIDLADSPATRPSAPAGGFGVGASTASVEYKDIAVSSGGQSIFQWDPSSGTSAWKMNKGAWSVVDGALRQSLVHGEFRATAGDTALGDYTISLKARKLDGENGLAVLFHYRDSENYLRWSIGGWHNTAAGIERVVDGVTDQIGDSTPITVQSGKWYDLRVELRGRQIRCYIDGQLANQATNNPVAPTPTLFALASRSSDGSVMTLQVVNTADHARSMEIDLMGAEHLLPWAASEILAGKPNDSNSVAQPMKIAPHRKDVLEVSPDFRDVFPAYSVTVIHLKLEPG
jgi:alpha-L-arabinofuranosidase